MPSPQPQAPPETASRQPQSFPTLGILGGGQLGKMMAQAALRLGLGVRLLSPKDAGPMQGFAHAQTGDWRNADVLRAFATGCDAVTVESEWAPAAEARDVLPERTGVWPAPETLRLISHKGRQKTHLRDAGLPVPDFRNCATRGEAEAAAKAFGYPVVAKQYEGSYDGYGNATCSGPGDLRDAWGNLAAGDGLMIERLINFRRELAVIVARRPGGQTRTYPVVFTEQENHRCHAVVAPAPGVSEGVRKEARRVGTAAVEAVEGVGVTAVELFETKDGRILVNELAPRPHNTGHYTIEACHTSQFENHVRAVLDLPLGDPSLRVKSAVMVNVLGRREGAPPRTDGFASALSVDGASVHVYGKPDVRTGRKMGHVTATGPDPDDVRARAERAVEQIRL